MRTAQHRTRTQQHSVLQQRQAPHAAVCHAPIRSNVLRPGVVGCDAPGSHITLKHQQVTPGEPEHQRMRDSQKRGTVDVLQVEAAEGQLLAGPRGAGLRVSCFEGACGGSPACERLAFLLLPPQLAVLLAPGDKCGGAWVRGVGVPGGAKDLQAIVRLWHPFTGWLVDWHAIPSEPCSSRPVVRDTTESHSAVDQS